MFLAIAQTPYIYIYNLVPKVHVFDIHLLVHNVYARNKAGLPLKPQGFNRGFNAVQIQKKKNRRRSQHKLFLGSENCLGGGSENGSVRKCCLSRASGNGFSRGSETGSVKEALLAAPEAIRLGNERKKGTRSLSLSLSPENPTC
jgi:hypothetical protein